MCRPSNSVSSVWWTVSLDWRISGIAVTLEIVISLVIFSPPFFPQTYVAFQNDLNSILWGLDTSPSKSCHQILSDPDVIQIPTQKHPHVMRMPHIQTYEYFSLRFWRILNGDGRKGQWLTKNDCHGAFLTKLQPWHVWNFDIFSI